MLIGVVADVHGNFSALTQALGRHPDVPVWLCVGDLASRTGRYPEPSAPIFWIKGNNEDFDAIAAFTDGTRQVPHLHYMPNGTATTVAGLRVAGLGGTYAPTWFETPAARLPHTPRDDKRRHFVREEVEACARLGGTARVDVLLTHEAPRPFILVSDPPRPPRRTDAGKPAINELLATLQPRLHLCGHHHRFVESTREGVRSVCVDRINRSYLLLDARTLEYEKIDQLTA